jgi:hypothetical protein
MVERLQSLYREFLARDVRGRKAPGAA